MITPLVTLADNQVIIYQCDDDIAVQYFIGTKHDFLRPVLISLPVSCDMDIAEMVTIFEFHDALAKTFGRQDNFFIFELRCPF